MKQNIAPLPICGFRLVFDLCCSCYFTFYFCSVKKKEEQKVIQWEINCRQKAEEYIRQTCATVIVCIGWNGVCVRIQHAICA